MADHAVASIEHHFGDLKDPRIDRAKRHKLLDIVVLAICGVICRADDWVSIEEFGNAKLDWFRKFLELPNGIPSHDTFGRVFGKLDPDQFHTCFINWILAVSEITEGQVIAPDGTTLRRSHDKTRGGKGILCMLRDEYDQARAFLRKNIEDHERTGDRMGYLWGRARLGYLALRQGSLAEAHQILADTIDHFHADQSRNGLAFALDRMASLYVMTNKPEIAAHLAIGWSDATRKEIGDPRPRMEQTDLDRDIAETKAKIGDAAYETAYTTGRALTLDEVAVLASGGKS